MLFNVRSHYTFLNSMVRLEDYVQKAKNYGYQALALTDNNLIASLEFQRLCRQYQVKAMYGLHLSINGLIQSSQTFSYVFFAKDNAGFVELSHLSRLANQEIPLEEKSVAIWKFLATTKALVMISDGKNSEIEYFIIHDQIEAAETTLDRYQAILGAENFYLGIEIYPYNALEIGLIKEFATKHQVSLLPNQLVNVLEEEDAFPLEVLKAINHNEQLSLDLQEMAANYYLRPQATLVNLYQEAGLQAAIDNADHLCRILNVTLEENQKLLPKYPTPDNYSAKDYLRKLSEDQLAAEGQGDNPAYRERLAYELEVIDRLGYNDYFLIVWELINYCHQEKIRTGPGRGSAAGSLVSYLLRITLVDPIEYDLLFERFLNPERASMPDIDIDIPDNKRDQVLKYIEKRYGHEQVAQISTIGTFGAKQAIRDSLRVLGADSQELSRWSAMIPNVVGISLDQAYQENAQLRALVHQNPQHETIFRIARSIEGFPRHLSTHAAAVVINDFAIESVVPVFERSNQLLITQYTMGDVEAMGLLKMDFLGLKNLKILDEMIYEVRRYEDETFDIEAIDKNDSQTLEIFQQALTNGVFQFESPGIQNVLRKLQPTSFEDIVAVNALYRPGPMQQIDHFIRRKHGQEKIESLHPLIDDLLEPTYGIIVYQEQIMQIAQRMAGFTLGEADILRRAISKKQADVIEQEGQHFIEKAQEKQVDEASARRIYQYIESFASYGFNRSHAVVYSTLAFQLAYIKAHYPLCFYQVLLNSGGSQYNSLMDYIQEAENSLGKLAPLDINQSQLSYQATSDRRTIRVGFSAIKQGRRSFYADIINDRQLAGDYTSLLDFLRRIDSHCLKAEWIQPLILLGAFDSLAENRRTLMENLATLMKSVKLSGNNYSLFEELNPKIVLYPEYDRLELLAYEQEYLGFSLSGHPLEDYQDLYQQAGLIKLSEIDQKQKKNAWVETMGMVSSQRVIRTKKDDLMAFITLEDQHHQLSVVVFPNIYLRYHHLLKEKTLLYVKGKVDYDRRKQKQIIANQLLPLDSYVVPADKKPKKERGIHCYIRILTQEAQNKIDMVKDLAKEYPGVAPIILIDGQKRTWKLSDDYLISHSYKIQEQLKELFGDENVIFQ